MSLWQWSTTAANNATAATNINWQEGQAPSTVNDSARQMMADLATWYQNGGEWLNLGDTPTYVSGTQFTVLGNLTARYSVGRRVRASVTAGTVYGTITASAYASVTTVTLALDSGALDSGLSEVDVGILNPAYSSVGTLPALNLSSASASPNGNGNIVTISAVNSTGTGASVKLIGNGSTTPSKSIRAFQGSFQVVNDAYNAVILSLDDAGDLSVTGNITASSDERLKEDWHPMARNFLERMAAVLHGTFTRKSDGSRSAGVGAQSLREVFPEVVHEDAAGMLSVAYGQAALVTVLELIPLVLRLLDEHGETP